MSTKKKKHHYVWQHYLTAWAMDGEQVWCLRKGGEPFRSHTLNIGQQRYFYRLREMTEQDLRFVDAVVIKPLDPLVQEMARGWIALFTTVFEVQREYKKQGNKLPDLEVELEKAITNFEEDLHSRIETGALSILDDLRAGHAAFTQDPEKLVAFMWFIAAQYLRTAKMKNVVLAEMRDAPVNIEAAWGLIRTIFSSTLGNGFFLRRDMMKITFLEAAEGTDFITGDQPIINVRADGGESPPEEVELYYALSPTRAVLIAFDAPSAMMLIRSLNRDETDAFNRRIVDEAHEQIYAASREALASLKW